MKKKQRLFSKLCQKHDHPKSLGDGDVGDGDGDVGDGDANSWSDTGFQSG